MEAEEGEAGEGAVGEGDWDKRGVGKASAKKIEAKAPPCAPAVEMLEVAEGDEIETVVVVEEEAEPADEEAEALAVAGALAEANALGVKADAGYPVPFETLPPAAS